MKQIILAHSDARAISSLLEPGSLLKSKNELLRRGLSWIQQAFGSNDLILPAFNYQFPKSKKFDPENDVVEVGALPEYARHLVGWTRTSTPVFSYTTNGLLLAEEVEPFGDNSTFSELDRNGGQILLIGVGCERLTFIHHLEHLAQIPYRYKKVFSGIVKKDGEWVNSSVSFHVRPLGLGLEYDFIKIEKFLYASNVITQAGPRVSVMRASDVRKAVLSKLHEDPFWLLEEATRVNVERRIQSLGRAFKSEDFE